MSIKSQIPSRVTFVNTPVPQPPSSGLMQGINMNFPFQTIPSNSTVFLEMTVATGDLEIDTTLGNIFLLNPTELCVNPNISSGSVVLVSLHCNFFSADPFSGLELSLISSSFDNQNIQAIRSLVSDSTFSSEIGSNVISGGFSGIVPVFGNTTVDPILRVRVTNPNNNPLWVQSSPDSLFSVFYVSESI